MSEPDVPIFHYISKIIALDSYSWIFTSVKLLIKRISHSPFKSWRGYRLMQDVTSLLQ